MGCILTVTSSVVPDDQSYSYPRYLNAKRMVDDRALNRHVWEQFVKHLSDRGPNCHVLEVGGGVGATFHRVVEAVNQRAVERLHYVLVDRNADNLATARTNVIRWASDGEYDIDKSGDLLILDSESVQIELDLRHADLFEYANSDTSHGYDTVIAQAVIDILDLSDFFTALRPCLQSGGLWYLPIHFDGLTAFEPPTDPTVDAEIIRLYHESMSGPGEEGGSRATTGRQLLSTLRKDGATLLEAGSSDWVVFPRENGYPDDEAYFLDHILHFIDEELSGHPALDDATLSQWLETRRQQIRENELIFIAHHLDVLARSA